MTIRLKCLAPRPMASTRLICVPFAGAGAAVFRGWADLLPAHVELFAVQLPGREDRLSEAAPTRWRPALDGLLAQVSRLPPQRTAIFGHSLGAVIGFELARQLQQCGSAPLEHLFVSARPWPGRPQEPVAGFCTQDDATMLAMMQDRFGALPASLSHPDIRDVVLPALRADLQLLDDHRYRAAPPLPCGLTVFAGLRDPGTDPATLSDWKSETSGTFAIETFDGGHFFVEDMRHEVTAAIASRLPAPPRW